MSAYFTISPLRIVALALTALTTLLLDLGCSPDAPAPTAVDPPWTTAFDTTDSGWLMSGWSPTGSGLGFVVGGTYDRASVYRFDGREWGPLERPAAADGVITWMHGTRPGDAFAVGAFQLAVRQTDASWTRTETPGGPQILWGVWASGPDDAWAVGGDNRSDGQPLLLRWNGVEWLPVAIPAIDGVSVPMLYKVWGTARDDVWAVGSAGAIFHYDGAQWRGEIVDSGGASWFNVFGTSRTNVAVVGGRGNGRVARFDGARWLVRSYEELPVLSGVWVRNANAIHICGARGTVAVLEPSTLDIRRLDELDRLPFHSLFGIEDQLVAVGGNLDATGPPLVGIAQSRQLTPSE